MKLLMLLLTLLTTACLAYQPRSFLINVGPSSRTHVSGLLEISKELLNRGHHIHYATSKRYHTYAKGYNFTFHELSDVSDELYGGLAKFYDAHQREGRGYKVDRFESGMTDFVYGDYRSSYDSLTKLLDEIHFDLMICDFYAIACRDVSYQKGIPMVISLQSTVAFELFHTPYTSNNVRGGPTNVENMSLFDKLYDLTVTQYQNWKFERPHTKGINRARTEMGLPTYRRSLLPLNRNLLLSVSFFGFEPAFHAPPNLFQVGPIRSPSVQTINEELESFLNTRNKVIYVSFGSYAVLLDDDIRDIIEGLKVLLNNGIIDGVIWGQGMNTFDYLEHPHIKFVPFTPQRALLKDSRIKVFISHCGFGGMIETIEAAKPILCFPLMGDQFINGAKAEEGGFGRQYMRSLADPEELARLVRILLEDVDGSFRANLVRLQAISDYRSAHAPSTGANLLEEQAYTAEQCRPYQSPDALVPCEVTHLIPVSERMSFLPSRFLDVYLFLLLIFLVIMRFLSRLSVTLVNRLLFRQSPSPKKPKRE